MLRANYLAAIHHLDWKAIGPGPDPAVLLETVLQVNETPLRLRAVRVFAPYSAGWTQDDTWELEPADVTDDIAWDVGQLKSWVAVADQMGEQAPPEPEPRLTRAMMALEEWWQEALDLFFWDDAEYPPLLIQGQPYQVVGYPADGECPAARRITLDTDGWGNDSGEPGFGDGVVQIEQSVFRLFGYEMLEIHGQDTVRQRSMNRKDEDYLRALGNFLAQPLSGGSLRTTPVAGASLLLLLQPLMPTSFCITQAQPLPAVGHMRWYFPKVDAEVAATAEALARMIRARHMAYHENRPIIVGTVEELDQWLPASVHPGRRLQALRKAVTLSAFGLGCPNCQEEHVEMLFQDASGSGTVFYVEPSPVGILLLDQLKDGELQALLLKPGTFETALLPEDPAFPGWVKQLPRMFDRQYRKLWENISRNIE